MKQKLLAFFGAISTGLGAIGVAIAEIGLCGCVLAPVFSLLGVLSIAGWYLSQNKIYFLIIGVLLLIVAFVFFKRKNRWIVIWI